jgi:hypothetical protein
MTDDLFALGQQYLDELKREFTVYGLAVDPNLELRRGSGLLCYYNLADGHIYLSTPELDSPAGKLQALFLRSLLGCADNTALVGFFRLFLRHIIAHEMAHHLRHQYHTFGNNMWHEEQVANKLSVAVVKHRLSPAEKDDARLLLKNALDALAGHINAKNIAIDSYYSPLHALHVSGDIGVADFENIEMIGAMFNLSDTEILSGSGQLTPETADRLTQRDSLIDSINEQYTADQIKYIYYHTGWLYLDLTSRETEYVDEFARNYLNIPLNLLPPIQPAAIPTETAIFACFRASQTVGDAIPARYFYKRYRTLLLARLKAADLPINAHNDRLRREATLILESWSEQKSDTLIYLVQLAPPSLRPLFPHRIGQNLPPQLDVAAHLPTETDRRLWLHLTQSTPDETAANTLHRLNILDRTDIYRSLPAHLMLELARLFSLVNFAAGETVIWQGERNDDVYFLISGRLQALINRDGHTRQVGMIEPGEMFGEISFFTEEPRQATVQAVEPSQCFVLTDVDLQLLAYRHPVILMQMAGVLAKRLIDTAPTPSPATL